MRGRIIKGVGGSYQVCAEDGVVYNCAAKGIFRHLGQKPLIGDEVEITALTDVTKENQANIVKLLERRNELIRPAVANVDQAVLIMALKNPEPNLQLLDRFLLLLQPQDVPVIICFNKADLVPEAVIDEYRRIYEGCGCQIETISVEAEQGLERMREILSGKTTVLAGPSGVGKSSFLNAVSRKEICKTGELSERIGRGKHTTRHTELLCLWEDTFVCDTPGFSSIELSMISAEMLAQYYPEFADWEGDCRFLGCAHYKEPDCGVKAAVLRGDIPKRRYDNYCLFYEEAKARRRY